MPEVFIVVIAVGMTVSVVLVIAGIRSDLREATTADTQPLPIDDVVALADSLHAITCDCVACLAALVDTARAVHEADQLEARYEQSET